MVKALSCSYASTIISAKNKNQKGKIKNLPLFEQNSLSRQVFYSEPSPFFLFLLFIPFPYVFFYSGFAGSFPSELTVGFPTGFFTLFPVMAEVGHFCAQMPQSVHFSFMTARLSNTWIASKGQFFSQIPQAIQPMEQASLTCFPFKRFLQETMCFFL